MTTLLAALVLAAPPSFAAAGMFGDAPDPPPVAVERPDISGKAEKDIARLADAIQHLGDRMASTERVARYAARIVNKRLDPSPTEDTGLDGWVTPTNLKPTAPPPGSVWCVECGAYQPAGTAHPTAYRYQPAAQAAPPRASYAAVRPSPGRG